MFGTVQGRYRVRLAETPDDLRAAQALRFRCFRGGAPDHAGLDRDAHDLRARHVLVEETAGGRLVCCFRMTGFYDGSQIGASYSARAYDLSCLSRYDGAMLEIGRFCTLPGLLDADVLRIAWCALGAHVEARGIALLFGCSSFPGTDAEPYRDAFALLRERHLAPRRWLPQVKAPRVFRFAQTLETFRHDPSSARRTMPPLLRWYLALGGWVSDHAVVDRELGSMHVFTGLEVGAVPYIRKRALRPRRMERQEEAG